MITTLRNMTLTGMVLVSLSFSQQSRLTVGTASAGPGEKATGFINVPAGSDAATSIPVVVVRGSKPGPVLAIISGAHGTEYASIIAVEQLITSLDPSSISGSVILIPLVNIQSFERKVPHVNPVDGVSMNSQYPGKANGTQTQRVSYLITKEVINQCDHLIDLHGGDMDEDLRPYSYWNKTGNEAQDKISREMLLAFGLDHILVFSDWPKNPDSSRYLENTASVRGKASITVEAGYSGTVEPGDVNALVHGCLNVMKYLKMLPGNVEPIQHPVWIDKVVTVPSEATGIFYPLVPRGSYVARGMKIGYVTDFFGNVTFEARSPVGGVVLFICSVPSMVKGNGIANIGVVSR